MDRREEAASGEALFVGFINDAFSVRALVLNTASCVTALWRTLLPSASTAAPNVAAPDGQATDAQRPRAA